MFVKETISAVAILITFIAFLPYIRSIHQKTTRPHVFSWIIWGGVTFTVFLGQLADGGGAGAWPIGISGLVTIYVAWLAYRFRADMSITRLDWIFLLLALGTLPLWYVTADPLWTVLLLTIVDLLGFGPTFRKAYWRPHEEHLTFFSLIALRNLLSIVALEHYSLTTLIFPAATGTACVVLILLVGYRRQLIGSSQ